MRCVARSGISHKPTLPGHRTSPVSRSCRPRITRAIATHTRRRGVRRLRAAYRHRPSRPARQACQRYPRSTGYHQGSTRTVQSCVSAMRHSITELSSSPTGAAVWGRGRVAGGGVGGRCGSGLLAVRVVPHLRLKRVHLRLHVEDPGVEGSEGLEHIHDGVDEHFYPYRGILALPQLAQGGHAVPDALRLAGDLVDAPPRASEGAFELVERVPQRGYQVARLVRLSHTRSLLCWSNLPAVLALRNHPRQKCLD